MLIYKRYLRFPTSIGLEKMNNKTLKPTNFITLKVGCIMPRVAVARFDIVYFTYKNLCTTTMLM